MVTLTLGGAWGPEDARAAWDRLREAVSAFQAHPVTRGYAAGSVARLEMHWSHAGRRWHPHAHIVYEATPERAFWPSSSEPDRWGHRAVCTAGRTCPECQEAGKRARRALDRARSPQARGRAEGALGRAKAGCGRDYSIRGAWGEVVADLLDRRPHPAWSEVPTVVDIRALYGERGRSAAEEASKYITKGASVSGRRFALLLAAVGSDNTTRWAGLWHPNASGCLVEPEPEPELATVRLTVDQVRDVAAGTRLGETWPTWARELLTPARARELLLGAEEAAAAEGVLGSPSARPRPPSLPPPPPPYHSGPGVG